MLKDSVAIAPDNIPNPSIAKGTIYKKLIQFIEETLYIFQKRYKGNINTAEEVLTQRLVNIFVHHSRLLSPHFIFQQEAIQKPPKGHNKKVDIGVFLPYADVPFFTLEAKRLPTLPKARKKEFVIGQDETKPKGGIERFKHNVHGINLPESALIAYVQDGTFKEWQSKINDWIDHLIKQTNKSALQWTTNDLLINVCNFEDDRIAKFISSSLKINKTTIKLFHYFINMMD